MFVLGMLVHATGTVSRDHIHVLVPVSLLFAAIGAIYGTIVALDRSADPAPFPKRMIRQVSSPKLRTFICALLAALVVVLVWSWSSSPFPVVLVALGAAVGAIGGWFGWRWAKHVDF